jgi:hypothetical protein
MDSNALSQLHQYIVAHEVEGLVKVSASFRHLASRILTKIFRHLASSIRHFRHLASRMLTNADEGERLANATYAGGAERSGRV